LVVAKPFLEVKHTLLELINELCLLILVAFLVYFNEEGRWELNKATEWVYTLLMAFPGFSAFVIATIAFIITIIKMIRSCKQKEKSR
jgi:hypothetical protein